MCRGMGSIARSAVLFIIAAGLPVYSFAEEKAVRAIPFKENFPLSLLPGAWVIGRGIFILFLVVILRTRGNYN